MSREVQFKRLSTSYWKKLLVVTVGLINASISDGARAETFLHDLPWASSNPFDYSAGAALSCGNIADMLRAECTGKAYEEFDACLNPLGAVPLDILTSDVIGGIACYGSLYDLPPFLQEACREMIGRIASCNANLQYALNGCGVEFARFIMNNCPWLAHRPTPNAPTTEAESHGPSPASPADVDESVDGSIESKDEDLNSLRPASLAPAAPSAP